jgi:maltose alpha-D-glucosyltransferase/alpha-amylase
MDIRDLWYKNAIIYALDVEAFQDANGDGIGDFEGLTQRLAYLAGLGVTCVWLHPFYPSPRRDHGYDVADYYNVDPRFGTLGDFVEFAHQAASFGMRIVVDLVINHTSNEHPWFQAARSDPHSKYRDYYVWSEERPENIKDGIVFPGYQKAIWSFDQKAKLWYYHRFYDFQPDLNFANPAVREDLQKIMGFWLEMGVSGFRVDAVPFLIEMEGPKQGEGTKDYEYLEEFRQFLNWRARDAIILGEANVELHELPEYFGDGDRMQMLLNFMVNQHLFNALAQEDATPLMRTLESLPALPPTAQWGSFLRNHDEIDLGRLTDAERRRAFEMFGPDPNMQLYDRGVRRRLAPMLRNDPRLLKLAYSLMFTLPGTPVLRYGDEIGMGDDLTLPERNSVRTPMQWSAEQNAGFSSAPPKKLERPVIADGEFGYQTVNVETQQQDPDSLLNTVERMIRLRKEHPEFGFGKSSVVDTGQSAIFALRAEWDHRVTVAVHNLSGKPCTVPLKLPDKEAERVVDVLRGKLSAQLKEGACEIALEPYGFTWLRVTTGGPLPERDGQRRKKTASPRRAAGQGQRSR